MRQLFLGVLAVLLCISICSVEAAKPQKKDNRFKSVMSTQQTVVEEEKTNSSKKINKKLIFGCGVGHPVRVAGFVTNAPFGWVNVIPPQGLRGEQYINGGFSYDLFAQLLKEAGMEIQNVGYTSYQEAMNDLRRGKIDVVAGAYFDKRILGTGVNLMFPGYFTNPIIPLFLKGKEKEVKTFDDLRGLKGVVRQEENIYSLVFNQLPKDIEIQQVSGSKKAFTMLLNGEVDYILTSLYAGEAEVRRYKLVDDIYFSSKALVSPELFFVFSSHSDCPIIKKRLEPILRKMKENKDEYMRTFVGYIDEWGLRFKDKIGLKEELADADREIQQLSDSQDNEIASDASDIETNDDLLKKESPQTNKNQKEEKNVSASDASDLGDPKSVNKETTNIKSDPSNSNRPLTAAERVRNL